MNTSPHRTVGWTAWFQWLLATCLGLIVGLAVFFLIGVTIGDIIDEMLPPFAFGLILGTIFGTAFGFAHWRVLRRYLPGTAAWVPASSIAFALAAAIVFGVADGSTSDSSVLVRMIPPVVVGLALGAAQWLVLRGKLRRQAHLWIVFSLVGWMLGEVVGILSTDLVEEPLPLMATFLAGASLPGIGMIWLLRRHGHSEADRLSDRARASAVTSGQFDGSAR